MKLQFGFFLWCLFESTSCFSFPAEIVKITLGDGEVLTGRVALPEESSQIRQLIIYVNSSGPHTYLDQRKAGNKEFNYFDVFAEEFTKRGIAFFSYSRRGVYLGNKPPFYDSIDTEKYKKYMPEIEHDDLLEVIKYLKRDKRFRKSKVVLLGWSEGTVLATLVAAQKKSGVDALLLAGYCNDRMLDIIKWQHSGEPTVRFHGQFFDKNEDDTITRSEYQSSEDRASRYRANALRNTPFETFDVNKDTLLTKEDFALMAKPKLDALMQAYEKQDDAWIWNNYFRVTSAWIKAHDALEPNSSRMLRLDIPIFIFQGTHDANTSVAGVHDIDRRFKEAGKKNLSIHTFKYYDHDLNFAQWVVRGTESEGISKMLEVAVALMKQ